MGYHFLGGVLRHARALCAVTSPTVNCYKRLKLGAGLYSSRSGFTWTPAFITYGDNKKPDPRFLISLTTRLLPWSVR